MPVWHGNTIGDTVIKNPGLPNKVSVGFIRLNRISLLYFKRAKKTVSNPMI